MKIFKEIKKIALKQAQIEALKKELSKKIDIDGIQWDNIEFVTLDKEDIEHFKTTNGVTEEYFVDQWTGYCEDDFYGYLYFRTDTPNVYVKVYFVM